MIFPIILEDGVAVKEFAEQVTVPPHGAVLGNGNVGVVMVAMHVVIASLGGRPHFETVKGGVNVCSHASPYVLGGGYLEDDASSACIAEVRSIVSVLMYIPNLKLGAVGIESVLMDGIAVPHVGRVEWGSVVVNSHGTVSDFVASVSIDVAHTEVVVALARIAGMLVGVEEPAEGQVLAIPIVGGEVRLGVVASAEDGAGVVAVEVGDASEEAVATVAVVVSPVGRIASWRLIIDGSEGSASLSIEYGEKLWAIKDSSDDTRRLSCPFTLDGFVDSAIHDPVGIGIANHVPLSVGGAIGSFADEFCSSIAIEVIDEKLGVMGSSADVGTEVDTPKRGVGSWRLGVDGRGNFVTIDEDVSSEAFVTIVVGVGWFPFEDDFVLSIAIHIPYAGIICRVGIASAIGCGSVGWLVEGNGQIWFQ